MGFIIAFVEKWADLISAVFGGYPFEGAIFTLIAVVAYLYLERNPVFSIAHRRAANVFIVFVGWLVGVPILGAILKIVYWALAGGGNLIGLLGLLYQRFVEEPLAVCALVATAILAYFIIGWARPTRPSRLARASLLVASLVLATLLVVPIVSAARLAMRGSPEAVPSASADSPNR